MSHFSIRHVTTYRYKKPVAFGDHRMMFRPRDSFDQRTLATSLDISPRATRITWSEDPAGNLVGHATFDGRARELTFTATALVERQVFDEAALTISDYAQTCPFSYGADKMPDLSRFLERQYSDPDHAVDRFAREVLAGSGDGGTWTVLKGLNASIRADFAYLRREEEGVQAPAETLAKRRGSCRDFAVLMIEAARSLGLAARFASGYLHVRSLRAEHRMAGGSTHAWAQIYLPGAGWIDFDPTSGTIGNADLIRVALVRDSRLASPLSGTFIGFPSDYVGMSVAVDVELVGEGEIASMSWDAPVERVRTG